jgi:hypothetical protein
MLEAYAELPILHAGLYWRSYMQGYIGGHAYAICFSCAAVIIVLVSVITRDLIIVVRKLYEK